MDMLLAVIWIARSALWSNWPSGAHSVSPHLFPEVCWKFSGLASWLKCLNLRGGEMDSRNVNFFCHFFLETHHLQTSYSARKTNKNLKNLQEPRNRLHWFPLVWKGQTPLNGQAAAILRPRACRRAGNFEASISGVKQGMAKNRWFCCLTYRNMLLWALALQGFCCTTSEIFFLKKV